MNTLDSPGFTMINNSEKLNIKILELPSDNKNVDKQLKTSFFTIYSNPIYRENIIVNEKAKLLKNILEYEEILDQSSIRALKLKALERANLFKEANAYSLCGKFYKKMRCPNCKAEFHTHVNSCNLRFCEFCCKKIYLRIKERVMPIVKRYSNTQGFRVVEITLTWKEGVNESDNTELEIRNKQVNKLLYWLQRRGKLKGSIKSYEMKRSSNDVLRLHIHVHILAVMRYVTQKELSEKWLKITKDSNVVDIRSRNPEGALNYLLKNLYNPPEILPSDIPTFIKLYYGRRRLITMGCFYRCRFSSYMEITSEKYCGVCGYELDEVGTFDESDLKMELIMSLRGLG